jgi:hypothetical protein
MVTLNTEIIPSYFVCSDRSANIFVCADSKFCIYLKQETLFLLLQAGIA